MTALGWKNFGSATVVWGYEYNGTKYVEISWSATGIPRPPLDKVEDFINSLKEAVEFAKIKKNELDLI